RDWSSDVCSSDLRLDLDDGLVDLDRVARLDVPLDDLGLGQALSDVRQLEELRLAHGRHHAKVRSTASRMRSRSGRYWSSTREGGEGVENPPTRSTGDSSR